MNPDEKGQVVDPPPEITLSGPFTITPRIDNTSEVQIMLRRFAQQLKEVEQSLGTSLVPALKNVCDALSTSWRANQSPPHGDQ